MERLMNSVCKKALMRFVLAFFCLICVAQLASATTVIVPKDEDMIVGARAIVRAQVLNVQASYDSSEDTVYSYITLRVREVIKGSLTERRIVLKEFGGETAGHATVV